MSWNLRFAGDEPPHAWPDRRPLMRELIAQVAPDIIGTQEGLFHQLEALRDDLDGYAWIGLGREGGSHGENMAVFYRTSRLEPLAYDHFWLSDTPRTIGSMTWGNRYPRMVTIVRFREKTSGREFLLWNTHLDHEVETARERSVDLILDRLAAVPPQLPVILTGDFNAPAEQSPIYARLLERGGFSDTWLAAEDRVGEGLDTFNGFRPGQHEGGRRIDWILFRGAFTVSRAAILDFSRNGRYPSDHFPVVAWLVLSPDA
ncbi:MAG: endonuclease/exonuclease/phosphatase family protein [Verrucomicrobia bacterium]|nr:MAG: endonuclease/exonuclease/phosphatase family protein [Verrucomicrobiota bacterium]